MTRQAGLAGHSHAWSSVVACEASPPPPPSSRVRSSVVACDTRQAGLAGPARTASSAGTSAWDQKYKLLLEFRTRFAHACPQQHCPVFGPQFGAWVHLQRSLANRGQLSKERVAQLEAIGFVFDGVEARQVRLRAKEQFESLFDKRQKQGQEGKEGREGKGRWEWDAAGRKRGRDEGDGGGLDSHATTEDLTQDLTNNPRKRVLRRVSPGPGAGAVRSTRSCRVCRQAVCKQRPLCRETAALRRCQAGADGGLDSRIRGRSGEGRGRSGEGPMDDAPCADATLASPCLPSLAGPTVENDEEINADAVVEQRWQAMAASSDSSSWPAVSPQPGGPANDSSNANASIQKSCAEASPPSRVTATSLSSRARETRCLLQTRGSSCRKSRRKYHPVVSSSSRVSESVSERLCDRLAEASDTLAHSSVTVSGDTSVTQQAPWHVGAGDTLVAAADTSPEHTTNPSAHTQQLPAQREPDAGVTSGDTSVTIPGSTSVKQQVPTQRKPHTSHASVPATAAAPPTASSAPRVPAAHGRAQGRGRGGAFAPCRASGSSSGHLITLATML